MLPWSTREMGFRGVLLEDDDLVIAQQRQTSAAKAVIAVASSALLGVGFSGVWLSKPHHVEDGQGVVTGSSLEFVAVQRGDACHTTVDGEKCFKDVGWAMTQGIHGHPEWYSDGCPDLHPSSIFEDFQKCVHKLNPKSCPSFPCAPVPHPVPAPAAVAVQIPAQGQPSGPDCETAKPGTQCYKHVQWALHGGTKQHPFWYGTLTEDSTFEEVQWYLHQKNSCPRPCRAREQQHAVHRDSGACRVARRDEMCYTNVLYGMRRGLFENPQWYPNLDVFSSFEDFQGILHRNPDLQCPEPCTCTTAKPGDGCFKNIQWVLREGLQKHAEWYPNLKDSSRWEAIQQNLHDHDPKKCATPCTPKVWGTPSLFCFSIFRSAGYELELVKSQIKKGVGIFNCDEFAILSDEELALPSAIKTLIIPPCEMTAVSKDGTSANTEIFMQAWKVIHDDLRYKAHDWVVKADPDAVLIIDRLRNHLAPHNGQNVFIQNCMKYEGAGWPTMFGSLEAFSHQAIETFFAGGEKRCKSELEWQSWGEDLFMNSCLTHLGVQTAFDGQLIGDNVCKGANCADGVSASYHPFKSPEAWFQCYSQATGVQYLK